MYMIINFLILLHNVVTSCCTHLALYERLLKGEAILDIVLSNKALFMQLLTASCMTIQVPPLMIAGLILKKGTIHMELTPDDMEILSNYSRFAIWDFGLSWNEQLKEFCKAYSIDIPNLGKIPADSNQFQYITKYRFLNSMISEDCAKTYISNLPTHNFHCAIEECITGELLFPDTFDHQFTKLCHEVSIPRMGFESICEMLNLFLQPSSSINDKITAIAKADNYSYTDHLVSRAHKFPNFLQSCIDVKCHLLSKRITGRNPHHDYYPILAKLSSAELSNCVGIPSYYKGLIKARLWFLQATYHPTLKSPVLADFIQSLWSLNLQEYRTVTTMVYPVKPKEGSTSKEETICEPKILVTNSSPISNLPSELLEKIFTLVPDATFTHSFFVLSNVCRLWGSLTSWTCNNCHLWKNARELLLQDFQELGLKFILKLSLWKGIFKNKEGITSFLHDCILNHEMEYGSFDLAKAIVESDIPLNPDILAKIGRKGDNFATPSYFSDEQIVDTWKTIAIKYNKNITLPHFELDIADYLDKRNVFDLLFKCDAKVISKVWEKLQLSKRYRIYLIISPDPARHPLEFINLILDDWGPLKSKEEIEDAFLEIFSKNSNVFLSRSSASVQNIQMLLKLLKKGVRPAIQSDNGFDYFGLFRVLLTAKLSPEDFRIICDYFMERGNDSEHSLMEYFLAAAFFEKQEEINSKLKSYMT